MVLSNTGSSSVGWSGRHERKQGLPHIGIFAFAVRPRHVFQFHKFVPTEKADAVLVEAIVVAVLADYVPQKGSAHRVDGVAGNGFRGILTAEPPCLGRDVLQYVVTAENAPT